jgi:hypothetical protein
VVETLEDGSDGVFGHLNGVLLDGGEVDEGETGGGRTGFLGVVAEKNADFALQTVSLQTVSLHGLLVSLATPSSRGLPPSMCTMRR